MKRKTLTLRVPPKLYLALSTLSEIRHRSMNDVVTEAVSVFVLAESKAAAQDLEKTLTRLRAYTKQDPDFQKAIDAVATAEVEHDDPLDGEVFTEKGSIRRQVKALLTDG